ncbi:MAG: GTPase domain-containing protein [Polyangiaceae bacterium]
MSQRAPWATMAFIDADTGQLVVRVTYDGGALSGKTTTLQQFARSSSLLVESPEATEGRTLYFDWVEYVSGLYDGKPIRCQLVSVPGQLALEERRWHLVDRSDVLVYVVDSTKVRFDDSWEQLERLHERLAAAADPAPGIIVQANKRDHPEAVPLALIQERAARFNDVAIIESIATKGVGVRPTFVFAVRLALDRVHALERQGALHRLRNDIQGSDDLLREVRDALGAETIVQTPAVAITDTSEASAEAETDASGELTPPDESIPTGYVWPPVSGRVVLHEYAATPIDQISPNGRGMLMGRNDGWLVGTADDDVHEDDTSARMALVAAAREHIRFGASLSTRRCVAAKRSGGRWRVWQIVGREPTLLEAWERALPKASAGALIAIADHLVRAHETLGGQGLPCTLATIGSQRPPLFVGLLPPDRGVPSSDEPVARFLERELSPALATLGEAGRWGLLEQLGHAPASSSADTLLRLLQRGSG